MSELAQIDAVILAGGLGTRLRPVVPDRPKALALVGGKPFLTILLERLAQAGLTRVVLCTGYKGEMVRRCMGEHFGRLRLVYSQEDRAMGTGGALRMALPLITGDQALVLNGDSLCHFHPAALERTRRLKGAGAVMLLAWVNDSGRYGRVELDGQGAVTAFAEKDSQGGPGWINAGVYLVERSLLESIPAGREVSLEREVFPAWIGRGLYGCPEGSGLVDIGTPQSYNRAQGVLV